MSGVRLASWRRLLLFLAALLASLVVSAAALRAAAVQARAAILIWQCVLAVAVLLARWRLRRGRPLLPHLPAPPWRHMPDRDAAPQAGSLAATRALRRQMLAAQLRTRLLPPAGRLRAAPTRPGWSPGASLARRARRTLKQLRLPLPTLEVQFVAPGAARAPLADPQIHEQLAALVGAALAQLDDAPPLVALHDHPRQLTCQLASAPLLTSGQQRAIVRALELQGLASRWDNLARLSVRRDSFAGALSAHVTCSPDRLWLPVLRTGQATVWWPLDRAQHLALAGAAEDPLTGLVERLSALPAEARPALLVHDPDRQLRELNATLAALPAQADALARARHAQLTRRFAHERGQPGAPAPAPVLLMVAPAAEHWSDLQPLLAPDSGVQVVLILSERAPLGALRAVCHRLPVIETPDPRYPALPDAFRPAGLPSVPVGQVLAWLPGGQTVWRGTRQDPVTFT